MQSQERTRGRLLPALGMLTVVLLLASGRPATGQPAPESAYSAMRWRLIGPFRAGRALAAAGLPGDPTTFYFGAVDGGVWKTSNAGLTWEPLFDDQPIASIGALAIAPSNPKVIYVGTGEADMRSDITYGNGVYRSTDGGAHWTHIGLEETRHIGKVLVDPRNPDAVLVAALGHAYGPNPERGVFRSTDGGRTWQKVLYRDPDTGAIDLALDPENPDLVYATLWNARRPPWSQYPPNEGRGSGIYRSRDGGRTWAPVTGGGLPQGPLGRIGLAVAHTASGARVYALIEARSGAGLYRSDDGGSNWSRVGTDPRITTRGWYFGRVFVDPQDPDVVYVPNRSVMRSTDGGQTFTAIKGSPGGDDYHYLWIDPTESRRMIVAADQGTAVSLDDGRTWSTWYNQPTAQFYHVATDDAFPYRVYGAQQDAGTVSITSRSDYGQITFRDWYSVGAGESGYIAPDPLNPDIVYGGDVYGPVYRFDRTTGQSQEISPWPRSMFGQPIPQRKYRFTWTSPLVFDPLDPHTLYLGSHMLLRTRDGGLSWDAVSTDLTGARSDAAPTEGPLTVENAAARGYGVIYTVAPSPLRAGLTWVGTDEGLIQLTTDGGAHWRNVTPPGLGPWSKISLIEASPFDTGGAYAAVDRHRLDDLAPYIYRTHDFGQHWTRIDTGIPPGAFVRAVRADPARQGLLYAGTETGVYVSLNDGEGWSSLQLNLPVASVRDLAVHDNDLIAATHGRAFWILDDLTPLQQLDAEVLNAPAHLFRPKRAIRIRRSENHDTPLPPETPHGTNPPAGAIIDYYLRSAPQGPVTLEVLDGDGHIVLRFSSEDSARSPTEPPYFMDAWLPRSQPLTRHRGLNRFVWDLRYPRPPADDVGYSIAAIIGQGTVEEPEGPLVLPGSYRLRLTVDGRSYTQPLQVEMDPRVTVSDAALTSQLGLALDIWNAIADAHALHEAANSLAAGLRDLRGKDLKAETRAAVTALEQSVGDVSDDLSTGDLASLEGVVQSADRQPTQQSRDVFAELQGRLTEARARWQSLIGKDLAQLNARLQSRGIAPLSPESRPPKHLEGPASTTGGP